MPDKTALADPLAFAEELAVRYPFGQVEITLLRRCGQSLAEVLRIIQDLLPLLFPDEGIGAANLYRDTASSRVANQRVTETDSGPVAALPEGRSSVDTGSKGHRRNDGFGVVLVVGRSIHLYLHRYLSGLFYPGTRTICRVSATGLPGAQY